MAALRAASAPSYLRVPSLKSTFWYPNFQFHWNEVTSMTTSGLASRCSIFSCTTTVK